MKKGLLILMLVVLSSLSFAARRDSESSADFYSLYHSAYKASGTETMHKDLGIEAGEAEKIKDIINAGWYKLKVLEADKLKEVFAIDMLLVDGPGNQKDIEKHLDEIKEISDEMKEVYDETKAELAEIMEVEKL